MGLYYSGIDEVTAALRAGTVSPVDLLEETLDRIEKVDGELQSYSAVMADSARAEAVEAEREISAGKWRGPLHGIPLAVKDLYGTAGAPTTFGSRHLRDLHVPEAETVTRLRAAGGLIVGKLRMSEAAISDHGVGLPVPLNPWDAQTWVGTSSSGCAAATAAGLCFGSLGSDTGGSVRGPATAAGLTGLKTTLGVVPTGGTLTLSRSLDTLGPFARSARDCRYLFNAMAGLTGEADASVGAPGRRLRLGVDPGLLATVSAAIRSMVEATAQTFGDLDLEIVEVAVPDGAPLAADWVTFVGHEALTDLGHLYPPEKGAEFGPEVKRVLDEGARATAAEIEQIAERGRDYQRDLDGVLEEVDAVLMPTIGVPSPTLADVARLRSDRRVWNTELMRLTCPINYSGHPALTLPTGFSERGTPLGAQLVGRHHSEHLLLHLGELFQSATDHHTRHPANYP